MGVLVVGSFSISRILYLLDVYYTRWEVGCQVNVNHRFHRFSQILWIELPAEGTEDTENTGAQEHKCIRRGGGRGFLLLKMVADWGGFERTGRAQRIRLTG